MNENMTQTYKHRILYYIHNFHRDMALLSKATSIRQWCKYVTHIMHSMSVTQHRKVLAYLPYSISKTLNVNHKNKDALRKTSTYKV